MNIFMAGVDYKTASLSVRERFSFSDEAVQKHVQQLARQAGVQGCLLLSTCNRTELYLSCGDDFSPDAAAMLCSLVDLPVDAYRPYFTSCQGHDVLMYLMQLASGLQSQVRGENQILGQVKAAVVVAREAGGMDAVLETVFRNAISAGKRTRTLVALNPVDVSVAQCAVQALTGHAGTLSGKQAIVIGNGEVGRTVADMLLKQGCQVTATFRFHRQAQAHVLQGCRMIPFEELYSAVNDCDILVSATSSPHYVVEAEKLAACQRRPRYLVDLAVPRDIEPEAVNLPGVARYWNVDTLPKAVVDAQDKQKISAIRGIHEEYLVRFQQWYAYRERLRASS